MLPKRKSFLRRNWELFIIALFMSSCTGTAIVLGSIASDENRKPVGTDIPEMFPVLVMTPSEDGQRSEAQVVYYKHLQQFLERNPEYTFLVPPGAEDELNEKVRQKSRSEQDPPDYSWESPIPWFAEFKVVRLSQIRQSLEVEGTWDDDRQNTGWYEATATEIFPRYHTSTFGPGARLGGLFVAVVLNVAVWGVGLLVWCLYNRLRKPKVPVQPAEG